MIFDDFRKALGQLGDPRFRRSVVLVCAHSDDGAMGIVLNQPMKNMQFTKLLDLLGIEDVQNAPDLPVRTGGPVEPVRGFVLHPKSVARHDGSMDVGSGLELTTTRDILVELAEGRGPDQAILALGYAGWGPGQLDMGTCGVSHRGRWTTPTVPMSCCAAPRKSSPTPCAMPRPGGCGSGSGARLTR